MAKTALVVKLTIHEGRMDEFLEVVRAHGEKSLALEPGCLRFDVLRPADAPHTVFLYGWARPWPRRARPHILSAQRAAHDGTGSSSPGHSSSAQRLGSRAAIISRVRLR